MSQPPHGLPQVSTTPALPIAQSKAAGSGDGGDSSAPVAVAGPAGPSRGSFEIFDVTAADVAAYFAAWCALMFRQAEQERFVVELLRAGQDGWAGRTIEVELTPDEGAAQVLSRLSQQLATVGLEYPASTRPRQTIGFTDLTGGPRQSVPAAMVCHDLHLIASGPAPQPELRIVYDAAQFSAPAIEGMANQYRALVAAFSAGAATALRNLPLMSPIEERRLLEAWSGPRVGEAPLVFREFERRARENPTAPAVTLNAGTLTYGELNQLANRVARWLRHDGIGPGSIVGVCVEPCLEFTACMLAAFKTGATHLPLDPGYPPERLAVILEDTAPALVLTQRALAPKLEPLLRRRVVCVEDLDDLVKGFAGDDPGYDVSPDQIAYIVYTSGTTGKPKGVLATQANLAHYVAVARAAYGYGPHDVIPAMARFTFSITFFELLCPLASGGRLLLLERSHVLDMARMAKTLQEITCIHASPSLWRRLLAHLDEQQLAGPAFQNLRHASSGGDMVPPDVLESLKRVFTAAEVFVIYGCSEVSCMGCTYPVPRDRTLASTRVGVPFPNMTLRLLDGAGNLVPPGIVGEVCFGGAGLASGYLHAPELTAKKFTALQGERVYHTGDLGRVDAEGNLELLGRSDFQIKLRGIRIEPGEIESTIRAVAGVKDVVVAAPMLPDGERRLVAYVVPDPAAPPTARMLRARLKAALPDYMLPAHYVFLPALPVNFNNKVDRLALTKATATVLASGEGETSDPPRTETERRLLQIWQEILAVTDIGIRDEFFDVGGDSLRSVTLMATVDKRLGVALPVSTLLTHPTIEQLGAVVDRRDAPTSTAGSILVCLHRGDGSRPPLFLVHDGDGETMPYRNLALRMHPGHTVYGIHPKSDGDHPILHTRLADMVDFYVQQIRSVQPRGPYFVGGLCIGGFLSFEVGRKLKAQGEEVGPIALIDVGHVKAVPRSVASRRMGHLSAALRDVPAGSLASRAAAVARIAARRALNVVDYEARSRFQRRKTRVKLKLLRYCLDHGMPLPPFLRHVSVDATLRFAEKEYVVPAPFAGEVILFRATARDPSLEGIVNDTPYIEIFEDPMLGWSDKATSVQSYDIPAGHSSMLREPNVKLVADNLQRHIDRVLASRPGRP